MRTWWSQWVTLWVTRPGGSSAAFATNRTRSERNFTTSVCVPSICDTDAGRAVFEGAVLRPLYCEPAPASGDLGRPRPPRACARALRGLSGAACSQG